MIKTLQDNDATVADVITTKSHPFRIKVYKVQITDAKTSGIWYAGKKGLSFYAVLSTKEIRDGFVPVFRLIKLSENKAVLFEPSIIKDIYPGDCLIQEELIVRAKSSFRHLTLTAR